MESKNEVRLTGLLVSVTPETTKNGKQIVKLILATDPPAWMTNVTAKEKIELTVFGRTTAEAMKLKPGNVVSVLGRVQGREWQGKLYVGIIGESFKAVGGSASLPAAAPPSEDDLDGVPF